MSDGCRRFRAYSPVVENQKIAPEFKRANFLGTAIHTCGP